LISGWHSKEQYAVCFEWWESSCVMWKTESISWQSSISARSRWNDNL